MDLLVELMTQRRPLIERLLLAVALAATGLAVRAAMQIEPGAVPFVTFYPMIAVASLIPGIVPGLLTLALTVGIAWFAILQPPYSYAIGSWSDAAGLLVFALMGVAFLAGGAAIKSSFVQVVRERDKYIHRTELRAILLPGLRYCVGHYLRSLSMDLKKRCPLPLASIDCAVLQESIGRLDALERLYRRLYEPEEFGTGSAGLFIEDICRDLMTVAAVAHVRCNVSAEPIWLSADRREALGLMVAELVSDAVERAPASGSSIDVMLFSVEPGVVGLSVRDAGGRNPWADRSDVCAHIPALTRALTRHLRGKTESVAGEDGRVTVTVVLSCSDTSEGATFAVWGHAQAGPPAR